MPATVRRSVWNVFKDTINLIILPLGIKRNFNPHNKGLKMYNYIYIYVYIQVARRLIFSVKSSVDQSKSLTLYLIIVVASLFVCFPGVTNFLLVFSQPSSLFSLLVFEVS